MSIDDIVIDPDIVAYTYEYDKDGRLVDDGIATLAADIALHGQITPLRIDKDNRLISGRRRLEALKMLGKKRQW